MQIVNFSDFARRKATPSQDANVDAAVRAPVTDRWAMLHTESARDPSANETHADDAPARDFWSDLQLRMAYPTLLIRNH